MSVNFDLIDVPLSPDARRLLDGAEAVSLPAQVLFGTVFVAAPAVSVVSRPDGTPLLQLGKARLASALCIDPATRDVVDIWDTQSPVVQSTKPTWTESFVNSTLDQFIAAARAITERFPYYSRNAPPAELNVAGDEVRAILDRIDPPSVVNDGFWSAFADDIAIGDFATEDLIAVSREIQQR